MATKKGTKKTVKKSSSKKESKKSVKKDFEDIELKKLPKEEPKIPKKISKKTKKINQNTAIIALLLNIIILPGLGTLIGRKTKEGIWQLALFFGGIIFGFLITLAGAAIIGIPLVILAPLAAWIMGIISGIELIKDSE